MKQFEKARLEEHVLETLILVLMESDTKIHGTISWKYWSETSSCYDCNVNKYGVNCKTSLRFWENKGWVNEIDTNDWFQWYFRYWLRKRSQDDERQIDSWNKVVTRFRDKLVKMIKDTGNKFDDYSVSPKIYLINSTK